MERASAIEEDGELLRRAAGGDAAAVRRFLDEVGPVVYGFVFARVGGHAATADDLVQETLLEAVRSAPGFRGESALTTWVCTIARRRLARHYERERRQEVARQGLRLVAGGELADGGGDDDRGGSEVDQRDEVVRALGRLSPLHRQVLVLKYLDNRSVAEIATELGRSRVQVQSLLQRARSALRRQMEDTDDAG